MFSSKKCDWETPWHLFSELNDEFRFTLDSCADSNNHKCKMFFTEEQNGLLQDWGNERVFCNPPYGREVAEWVKKCYFHSMKGSGLAVMLLPARTDTQWFHEYVYETGAEIRFLKGRLKFGNAKNSAPFPSMIVIFQ